MSGVWRPWPGVASAPCDPATPRSAHFHPCSPARLDLVLAHTAHRALPRSILTREEEAGVRQRLQVWPGSRPRAAGSGRLRGALWRPWPRGAADAELVWSLRCALWTKAASRLFTDRRACSTATSTGPTSWTHTQITVATEESCRIS